MSRHFSRVLPAVVVPICLAAGAAPAAAQLGPNLIDPAGWSAGQNGGPCPGGPVGTLCLLGQPGSFTGGTPGDPLTAHPGTPGRSSETIATVSGAQYRLGFSGVVQAFSFGSSLFEVFWGGTRVFSAALNAGQSVGPVGLELTASGAATTLQFSSQLTGVCQGGTCDDWGTRTVVRNIALQQIGGTAVTTPEPATLALVAGGLVLVGATRRRRTRAA